jgi:hypothetical protein
MLRRPLVIALVLALLPAASADAAVSRKKAISGPTEFEGESLFPTYRDLGAGIYQTKLEWDKVAVFEPLDAKDPLDAAYDWPPEIDNAVTDGREHGIDVALTVTGTPEWANSGKSPRVAPRSPKAYADFLTAAARRYPGVHLWIIWDSPTRRENLSPLSAGGYARLLDGAYGALKARSRRNLVVGGNSATTGASMSTERWLRELKLPNGKRPRLDLYGHNPSSRNGLRARDIDTLEAAVTAALGRKRLFLDSFTLPTAANWRYPFRVTRKVQASRLTAAIRAAKRDSSVYSLGYSSLYDEERRLDNRQVESGLLDADGKKRPAYRAFKRG